MSEQQSPYLKIMQVEDGPFEVPSAEWLTEQIHQAFEKGPQAFWDAIHSGDYLEAAYMLAASIAGNARQIERAKAHRKE